MMHVLPELSGAKVGEAEMIQESLVVSIGVGVLGAG